MIAMFMFLKEQLTLVALFFVRKFGTRNRSKLDNGGEIQPEHLNRSKLDNGGEIGYFWNKMEPPFFIKAPPLPSNLVSPMRFCFLLYFSRFRIFHG